MKPMACAAVARRLDDPEIYVLIVSEDCPHCREIMDRINEVKVAGDMLVVNVDSCSSEVGKLLDDEGSIPVMVHLRAGKVEGRVVGSDQIIATFGGQGVTPATPVEEPPTGTVGETPDPSQVTN